MHKQKAPARDSQFLSLRHAVNESGLSYSRSYGAVKRREIHTLSADGDGDAVISLLRASFNAWIDQRLTRRKAA
jgi:hypothetical protein